MSETSMVGKLQHSILNRCENRAFFNYFHSKVSFLSSSMFVLLFEKMLQKLNAYANIRIIASFFLNREYICYSGQCIFRKYWKEYYTLC